MAPTTSLVAAAQAPGTKVWVMGKDGTWQHAEVTGTAADGLVLCSVGKDGVVSVSPADAPLQNSESVQVSVRR